MEISLRHIPGIENKADALTRIFDAKNYDLLPQLSADLCALETDSDPNFSIEKLLALQRADDAIQRAKDLTDFYFTDTNSLVRHKSGTIYLPFDYSYEIMKDLHIQAGHLQRHDLLFTFQQSIFNPEARKLANK